MQNDSTEKDRIRGSKSKQPTVELVEEQPKQFFQLGGLVFEIVPLSFDKEKEKDEDVVIPRKKAKIDKSL